MDYKKKYLKYKLKYLNIRKLSGGGEPTTVGDKRSIHQILAEEFPEAIEAEPGVNKKKTRREKLIDDLFVAIENKDVNGVKTVLEQDPTLVNTGDPLTGDLPLNIAVSLELEELVNVLLSYDANVNAQNIAGLTPLIIAAKRGHDLLIHKLLEDQRTDINYSIRIASKLGINQAVVTLLGDQYGADVNYTSQNGSTALLLAAQNGHNEVVNTLIRKGADVNTKSYHQNVTPIMFAAHAGHNQVVDTLIENGGDINIALMNASSLGYKIVVRTLIDDHGADAVGRDGDESTALMMAARNGHIAVVNILFERGALASVNYLNRDGYSALMYAASNGHNQMVTRLLTAGADSIARSTGDSNSSTALMMAAERGHIAVVDILLKEGALPSVNYVNSDGYSALMYAAREGHDLVVTRLLEAGAYVHARNLIAGAHAYTALHYAAQKGHLGIVNILLENGADAVGRDGAESTVLMTAANRGHIAVVNILLERGALASVNYLDMDGYSALMYAASRGHNQIVTRLLTAGADAMAISTGDSNSSSVLMMAAASGHIAVVDILLEEGALPSVNYVNSHGYSALMYAAREGHDLVVTRLLEAGADVHARNLIAGAHSYTALHYAAKNGHLGVVNILLENGADIHARTVAVSDPHTASLVALHIATINGHLDVVNRLLNHPNADVDIRNHGQRTALMLGAALGHDAIVNTLLDNGANIEAHDRYFNHRALHYAAKDGHLGVVNILLENGADIHARTLAFVDNESPDEVALHIATRNGHLDVVNRLLNHPDADVDVRNHGQRTALIIAAGLNNVAIANTLLERDADINAQSISGNTPLMRIAESGNSRMLDTFYYRNNGIRPRARIQNSDGETALHIAVDSALASGEPEDGDLDNAVKPMEPEDRRINFVNKFIRILADEPPNLPEESLDVLYTIQNNNQVTAPAMVTNWEANNTITLPAIDEQAIPQQQHIIRTGINFNPHRNQAIAQTLLEGPVPRDVPYPDGIANILSM